MKLYRISSILLFFITLQILVSCKGGNRPLDILGIGNPSDSTQNNSALVLEFNTGLHTGTAVSVPLYGSVNVIVDWGDGIQETITSEGDLFHTYSVEGIYTVSITGELTQFGNKSYSDLSALQRIKSWGSLGLVSLTGACYGAKDLIEVPSTLPSTVEDLSYLFAKTSTFNQNIGGWDVSKVTNLQGTFFDAASFNQDIGAWDVSSVTNMYGTFMKASWFNQDIGGWDVSKVTTMYGMFVQAELFNQNIGAWDVSSVTNMHNMFQNTVSFNQDIGNWDVSNVTDMSYMFSDAASFNQDIGDWDVSKVTQCGQMFQNAVAFNQDIGDWDVSNVTTMRYMFSNASTFNQDIGGWDVSKVTNMKHMFSNASSFDQDIGNWNVSNVSTMLHMFNNALSFDQNLGRWNIVNVIDLNHMFYGVKLSTVKYDSLLIGWSDLTVPQNLTFHGGNSTYSASAVNARQILTTQKGWNIVDGGLE